ncbi:unnamed protein product, partial [Laminaria digitata]
MDYVNCVAKAEKEKIFDVILRCADVNRAALLAPSLKHAASTGDVDMLGAALLLGACPNIVYPDGECVLHVAAASGNRRVISDLLHFGALVNALDGHGRNALQLLADSNADNPWAAASLLASGADARYSRTAEDSTALQLAVHRRNIAVVKTILLHGVHPQDIESGYTSLHAAVAGDEVEVIRVLAEAGGNVDAQDGQGHTPLHIAVRNNNPEAVRALCECRADMNKLCNLGYAPLHVGLMRSGRFRAVAELLNAGANANVRRRGERQTSALDLAATRGSVKHVKALLDHGADAKGVGATRATALHRAAKKNRAGVIGVLVEAGGADVNALDADQQTPLHHACALVQFEAVDALVGHGASIDARDRSGETPLHRAARGSHGDNSYRIVELLLERGADATAIGMASRTPVEVVGLDAQAKLRLSHPPIPSPSVVELLVKAAAWRRRGFLVMCRAHPTRAEPKLPEHLAGAATSRRGHGMVTRSRARKVAR